MTDSPGSLPVSLGRFGRCCRVDVGRLWGCEQQPESDSRRDVIGVPGASARFIQGTRATSVAHIARVWRVHSGACLRRTEPTCQLTSID